MVEASRNAAVALAVRDLISAAQFDYLYRPFRAVIPLGSDSRKSTQLVTTLRACVAEYRVPSWVQEILTAS